MISSIDKTRLLVVEGPDDEKFFYGLFKAISLPNIQIIPIHGKDKLRPSIEAIRNLPNFEIVDRLGVIRDADTSSKNTFHSICDALSAVDLPRPKRVGVPFGRNPRIGVYILPGRGKSGMLEDLCFSSVEDQPQSACVAEFLKCIKRKKGKQPSPLAKAKIQAYLASLPKPGLRLGEAAEKGYWPFESPAFKSVKAFLRALFR